MTNARLNYIDFVKGLAAIFVILLHTIPVKFLYNSFAVYHLWQAVPLFIFCSFYLGFLNLENKVQLFKIYYSKERIKKLFLKLWVPLIILAVLEAGVFAFSGNYKRAISCIFCYGNGPGSYYIWCYMQIWILIPIIYILFKKCKLLGGGIIIIMVSLVSNYFADEYLGIVSRYCCFRFIFSSIAAYMFLIGITIRKLLPYILLSIVSLYIYNYYDIPDWLGVILSIGIDSFYTYLLFVLLSKCYSKLNQYGIITYISHIGTISWEVFIIQMVLIGSGVIPRLFPQLYNQVGFYTIVVLFVSILFAELYKYILNVMIYNRISR